jgi:hypothetical protein
MTETRKTPELPAEKKLILAFSILKIVAGVFSIIAHVSGQMIMEQHTLKNVNGCWNTKNYLLLKGT